jgi:hypothetical protein
VHKCNSERDCRVNTLKAEAVPPDACDARMRHPDRHGRALGDDPLPDRGRQRALGLADLAAEVGQVIRQH